MFITFCFPYSPSVCMPNMHVCMLFTSRALPSLQTFRAENAVGYLLPAMLPTASCKASRYKWHPKASQHADTFSTFALFIYLFIFLSKHVKACWRQNCKSKSFSARRNSNLKIGTLIIYFCCTELIFYPSFQITSNFKCWILGAPQSRMSLKYWPCIYYSKISSKILHCMVYEKHFQKRTESLLAGSG